MRLHFLTFLANIALATMAASQSDIKFSVEIPQTTVVAGESFDVKYVLKNGKNGQFVPPDWEAAGLYVTLSSQSSSLSFSNGVSNAESVHHYQVIARDTGLIEIPVARFVSGKEELRTEPTQIRVLPGAFAPAPPSDKHQRQTAPPEPRKKIKTVRI